MIRVLADRQAVHVRAEQHRGPLARAGQLHDETCPAAQADAGLEPHRAQGVDEIARGLVLLERQLGMKMQGTLVRDDRIAQGASPMRESLLDHGESLLGRDSSVAWRLRPRSAPFCDALERAEHLTPPLDGPETLDRIARRLVPRESFQRG